MNNLYSYRAEILYRDDFDVPQKTYFPVIAHNKEEAEKVAENEFKIQIPLGVITKIKLWV